MFKQTLKFLSPLIFFVLFISLQIPAEAKEKKPFQTDRGSNTVSSKPDHSSAPPAVEAVLGRINAKSAMLVEVSTGTTIFEQNVDEIIEPASFTKILTLYLVNEALKKGAVKLDDEIYITEQAWKTGGSKMFLRVGTKVPLGEIMKGIAVVSGNDAAVAAAEHLAGSVEAFVVIMNQKSRELGMTKSRFLNPHGLPVKGQITTARDMVKMNLAYLRQFPESLQIHSMKEYSHDGVTQENRNRLLLRDSSVDGLKTGYVAGAGYHLAATAQRGGMRLLAVIMGAPSAAQREQEAMKLLSFGFRFYTLAKPFPEGKPVSTIKVWKGKKDDVDLYPLEIPAFVIAQADKNSLRWEVRANPVTAPVPAGAKLGEVVFYVSNKPQKTVPLVNHEELVHAGWFKRTWQGLLLAIPLNWKTLGMAGGAVIILLILLIAVTRRKSRRRSRGSLLR